MTIGAPPIDIGIATDQREQIAASLARVLADSGASIKDIFHERAWVDSDVAVVRVKVVVEVVDHAAGHRMFEELEAKGYSVEKMGPPVAKT